MISRDKIIEAAARVYSLHGFRGATTRLIANEAGVNEVTLFRIFGSKTALLDEVAQRMSAETAAAGALPSEPTDPEREVTAFARAQLQHLWSRCSMIRKTMSEMEDRPDLCQCVALGPTSAARQLREYIEALQKSGRADRDIDPVVPSAMLLGALFADAMGRDFMPGIYPPATRAAELYTKTFLKSIGAAGQHTVRRVAGGRKRPASSRRKAS